ncbi:MAG: hypothetical protein ACK4FM_03925 [Caldimicrobium sp.]
MKTFKSLFTLTLVAQLVIIPRILYAGSAYDYQVCPGCGGHEERTYYIPEPRPVIEPQSEPGSEPSRKCYVEEYVCGQTCWEGSFDGDRSRQGMGYCIDKICTRIVCE